MRMYLPRTLFALICVSSLAACGDDAKTPADDNRQAGGEVLEGTISDAMIPLDTLRSQGKALEKTPVEGNAPAASESSDAAENEGEEGAEPAEAPAEPLSPDVEQPAG